MLTNRWYDKDRKLARYLDSLKTMNKKLRNEVVAGIMDIIREDQPSLIDDHVLEFPLDLPQRRWYDRDPYLWLIFNGLSQADAMLLEKVKEFLSTKIKHDQRSLQNKV